MQDNSSCQDLRWVTARRTWSAADFPWRTASGTLHCRAPHDAGPVSVQIRTGDHGIRTPILTTIITALGGIIEAVVAAVLAARSG
jgi:hypothetical protein